MSKLYIVRPKDYRKDVLAIILAADAVDLFWTVDEQVNPYSTEYARLPDAGGFGLFWLDNSSGLAWHWLYDKHADIDEATAFERTEEEEARDYAILPVGAPYLTQVGEHFLSRFHDLKWKDFTRKDRGY